MHGLPCKSETMIDFAKLSGSDYKYAVHNHTRT